MAESTLIMPDDIFCLICKFIDDRSFVNFTTTSKFYLRFILDRPLSDTYSLSKILLSRNNYVFIKIIYDYNKLLVESIPKSIISITFNDDFNDNIIKLYSLPKLEFIGVGKNFANMESIQSIPQTIINKKDLVLTTIANILSFDEYEQEIKRITVHNTRFPIYFNKTTIYKIKTKMNKKMLAFIENNSFDVDAVNHLAKINLYIPIKWKDQSMVEFLSNVDIFDKYKHIMAQKNPDTCFLKNNHCLIKEFIEITQIIYDKKQIFLDHIYQKILDKYQCSTISEFAKLCSCNYKPMIKHNI